MGQMPPGAGPRVTTANIAKGARTRDPQCFFCKGQTADSVAVCEQRPGVAQFAAEELQPTWPTRGRQRQTDGGQAGTDELTLSAMLPS